MRCTTNQLSLKKERIGFVLSTAQLVGTGQIMKLANRLVVILGAMHFYLSFNMRIAVAQALNNSNAPITILEA